MKQLILLGVPVSIKNTIVWTNITYTNAVTSAQSMYSLNNHVKSGLMTGIMWDTVCKWVDKLGYSDNDSSNWGNYNNSSSPANVSGYGTKQKTGYSEYWKANNIYDLAGNSWEWISEKHLNSGSYVVRGGSHYHSGSSYSSIYRNLETSSSTITRLGFRVALYVL